MSAKSSKGLSLRQSLAGGALLALAGAAYVLGLRALGSDAPGWAQPLLTVVFLTAVTVGCVIFDRLRRS